jgi:hypothetical protein
MTKTIRAIIICSITREVRETQIENSLEEFQRICGVGYIEHGIWINRRDVLYVNVFPRWAECFEIGGKRAFSGCGLITAGDGTDGSMDRSARVPLEEIGRVVRFGIRERAKP